jgi:hypothetical protein
VGGQVVGTWARSLRRAELEIALHPFAAIPRLVEQVKPEAIRYRDFLGLPSGAEPVVRSEAAGA